MRQGPALSSVDWLGSLNHIQCYDSWSDEVSERCGVAEISAGEDYFQLTSHQHPLIADFSAPSDRHRIAALALHRQSFGFDWEDVDLLESEASTLSLVTLPIVNARGDAEHAAQISAKAAAFSALADRISALLPPRPAAHAESATK